MSVTELSATLQPLRLKVYQMSVTELPATLQPLGLKVYLWDYNYWFISLVDWGKVLKDVCFGMPKYTVDRWDCEQFAMLTTARVGERYQINTCGIAIGQSPWGEHGYNLLVTETGLMYFEPQDGMMYPVEENSGYKAHTVLFG